MSLVLGLGLEHSCPWPRESLSSERLSLALDFFVSLALVLASSLVSSTPPLIIINNQTGVLNMIREFLSFLIFSDHKSGVVEFNAIVSEEPLDLSHNSARQSQVQIESPLTFLALNQLAAIRVQ